MTRAAALSAFIALLTAGSLALRDGGEHEAQGLDPAPLVIFVVPERAPRADWLRREAMGVFDSVGRAAVVTYGPDRGARIDALPTVDRDRVEASLWGVVNGAQTPSESPDAAILARAIADGEPCPLVVMFVYGKNHIERDRADETDAANTIRRAGLDLMVRCPVTESSWHCQHEKGLPSSEAWFSEYDDVYVLATQAYHWRRAASCPVPTETPTLTPTVAWSATPPPTPFPTATHGPIFLPVVSRTTCEDEPLPLDTVLVIDASTSMLGDAYGGTSRMGLALEAATLFVNLLEPSDRVAVVGFNSIAWIETGALMYATGARAAISRLPAHVGHGTRIDLGLDDAREALAKARPRKAVVLLTDGFPNQVPTPTAGGRQEDTVMASADALKAAGARVFTVAIGIPGEVPEDLLRGVASSRDDYYFAPNGEDLDLIYSELAESVRICR